MNEEITLFKTLNKCIDLANQLGLLLSMDDDAWRVDEQRFSSISEVHAYLTGIQRSHHGRPTRSFHPF